MFGMLFLSDTKIVCDAVTECSEPPLAISSLIEGIRQKLQDFRKAQVSHVLRLGCFLPRYGPKVLGRRVKTGLASTHPKPACAQTKALLLKLW